MNLEKASKVLEKSKYGLELRKLATISDVSQDQSNTIIFAMPLETLDTKTLATTALSMTQDYKKKKD